MHSTQKQLYLTGAAYAAFFIWCLLWYPWQGVNGAYVGIYVHAIRECFPAGSALLDQLVCSFETTRVANGQLRPTQLWLFAQFLDPDTLLVHPAMQGLYFGVWVLLPMVFFRWLRVFNLGVRERALAAVLLLMSSSISWYAAGVTNPDSWALLVSMLVVVGLTVVPAQRRGELAAVSIAVLLAVLMAGLSNTARITATGVLAASWLAARNLRVRLAAPLVTLLVLVPWAAWVESQRKHGSSFGFSWGYLLAVLSLPAGIYSAYLLALVSPGRWRWPVVAVITALLVTSSGLYDIDFGKGDSLWFAYPRVVILSLLFLATVVLALARRTGPLPLALAGVGNLALILWAGPIAGAAQKDPNPRNFFLTVVWLAVVAAVSVVRGVERDKRYAVVATLVALVAVGYHGLVHAYVNLQGLATIGAVEKIEYAQPQVRSLCANLFSQQSNVYASGALLLARDPCEHEWIVYTERMPEVAEFWRAPGGVRVLYFQNLFGEKTEASIPQGQKFEYYTPPVELPDMLEQDVWKARTIGWYSRPMTAGESMWHLQAYQ